MSARREFGLILSGDFKGKALPSGFIAGERAKGEELRKRAADWRMRREAAGVGVMFGLLFHVAWLVAGLL